MGEQPAHLRDDRYCSAHGIDLVPPDRTLRTRRYCPQCPPGSALGFPAFCARCDEPIVRRGDTWMHAPHARPTPCPRACPDERTRD
jgi:hypothetical protein